MTEKKTFFIFFLAMNFEKAYYTSFPMTRKSFSLRLADRLRKKYSLSARRSDFFLACIGKNRSDLIILPANFLLAIPRTT